MDFARHEANLSRRAKDGHTQREHLEGAAARGVQSAIAELEGPPLSDGARYLWDWALELHGRSGIGMSGFAPLTYTTVADWARLTGNDPSPEEVDVLLQLDAVLLSAEVQEAV